MDLLSPEAIVRLLQCFGAVAAMVTAAIAVRNWLRSRHSGDPGGGSGNGSRRVVEEKWTRSTELRADGSEHRVIEHHRIEKETKAQEAMGIFLARPYQSEENLLKAA